MILTGEEGLLDTYPKRYGDRCDDSIPWRTHPVVVWVRLVWGARAEFVQVDSFWLSAEHRRGFAANMPIWKSTAVSTGSLVFGGEIVSIAEKPACPNQQDVGATPTASIMTPDRSI